MTSVLNQAPVTDGKWERLGVSNQDESRTNTGRNASKSTCLCGSYRLFVVLCCSMAMCMSFASQSSMSSAMVCMTKEDVDNNTYLVNYTSSTQNAILLDRNGTTSDSHPWRFSWDSETKGWVISSFFVGYYIMQIPSGILVSKAGPKRSMVIGLCATGLFHLLTIPVASWSSLPVLYLVRFLAGITCGCMMPGVYALVANWTPVSETSTLFGIAAGGLEFGNSLSFIIPLFGCQTDFQGGWSIVFYTIGFLHVLTGITMLVFVTNFPSTNRFISPEEVRHITTNSAYGNKKRNDRIPYRRILTSLPVWGMLLTAFGTEWLYYTVTTQGPLFLRDILGLSPSKTSIVSAIPFMVNIGLVYMAGYTSDQVVKRRILSTTSVRKVNETYSKIFTTGSLLVLGFLPRGAWLEAFFLYLMVAIGIAGAYTGYMANPGDLSPAHAGFLAGLMQGATIWTSFVIPVLTGSLTGHKNRQGWQLIFYITAVLQAISLICYLFCGSGQLQPWAIADVDEETPILDKEDSEKKAVRYV